MIDVYYGNDVLKTLNTKIENEAAYVICPFCDKANNMHSFYFGDIKCKCEGKIGWDIQKSLMVDLERKIVIPNAISYLIGDCKLEIGKYFIYYGINSFSIYDLDSSPGKFVIELKDQDYPKHNFQDMEKVKKQINMMINFQ